MYEPGSVAPAQMSPSYSILEPALFSTPLDPSYLWELLSTETQSGAQLTGVNDRANVYAAYSPLILSPSPPLHPSQPITFEPPKWHEIPQRPYDFGRKQRGYTPSGPILFQVNGFPGVSMGDALRGTFTSLENQNDLVLQDAKMAISCRFLVHIPC